MIDRRQFLKMQAMALLGTGLSLHPRHGFAAQPDFPDLVVVKGEAAAATREAVNLLGGMSAFVKKGQRVVIKPNASFVAGPDTAANTHPLVVATLLAMCLEAGAASVRILDHAFQGGSRAFESSGILSACDSFLSGACHNLTQSRQYKTTELAGAVEMHENAVMNDVLAADVLILAPVAKSHSSTGVSLSLKGQMGLVLDRNSMHSRHSLDNAIVDLAGALKPDLVVIDAIRVLSSNGPEGPGRVLFPGEIIASRDPVAADALAVDSYEWYGRKIKPRQVRHILLASQRGLGRIDLENLVIRRVAV